MEKATTGQWLKKKIIRNSENQIKQIRKFTQDNVSKFNWTHRQDWFNIRFRFNES